MTLFFGGTMQKVYADEAYTFEFHNQTQSFTGQTVNKNFTFQKMGYWQVEKATLNFNFQLTQLSQQQDSDLTVIVNGVKVASFRPDKTNQWQTRSVDIPVELIQSTNTLQISGQIVNKVAGKYKTQATPANWLTIYEGANINFQYTENAPQPTLSSFFQYFTGLDKLTRAESAVMVNKGADDSELTAAATALMGQSKMRISDSGHLQLISYSPQDAHKYQVIVAKYNDLPVDLKKYISATSVTNHGVLKTIYNNGKYQLVITAKTDKLLKKAAEFFANHELMQERKQPEKQIDLQTKTNPAVQKVGELNQLLTTQDVAINGLGKQEQLFDINLPAGQTQALGSKIAVNFNYSSKLDFKKSQIKVYVNDQLMATKHLTVKGANDDNLTIKLPQKKTLQNSYAVKVVLDLAAKKNEQKKDVVWAQVTSNSLATIKTQAVNTLLLNNFPGMFTKEHDLSKLVVVRPRQLTTDDLKSLSNIFTLISENINSAHGLEITTKPTKHSLNTKNVIAVGTPQQNGLIKQHNTQLYFKFDKHFNKFTSNEKLSIEDDWGKRLGSVQLLRSPYNKNRAFLVATAPQSHDIYLATMQLAEAKVVAQYQNKDAFVVDEDNISHSYRFKKDKILDHQLARDIHRREQRQLYIYLLLAIVSVVILVAVTWVLVVRKDKHERRHIK